MPVAYSSVCVCHKDVNRFTYVSHELDFPYQGEAVAIVDRFFVATFGFFLMAPGSKTPRISNAIGAGKVNKRIKFRRTPFKGGASNTSATGNSAASGDCSSALKLFCCRCTEEVDHNLSKPLTKGNEMIRLCLHCIRTDTNLARATKDNPTARKDWKDKPKDDKTMHYKAEKRKREANGGRTEYRSGKSVRATASDFNKDSKVRDFKDHLMTFTQFALQQIGLKLAANIEEAEEQWKTELARDDRRSAYCDEKKQWLLEDFQGVSLIRREEKGLISQLESGTSVNSREDLKEFGGERAEQHARRRRAIEKDMGSGVSSIAGPTVQTFDVDGQFSLGPADIGDDSFEGRVLKDMQMVAESEQKKSDEILLGLIEQSAGRAKAKAKQRNREPSSCDSMLKQISVKTAANNASAALERQVFLLKRKYAADLREAESAFSDFPAEGNAELQEQFEAIKGSVETALTDAVVEQTRIGNELIEKSKTKFDDINAMCDFEKQMKETVKGNVTSNENKYHWGKMACRKLQDWTKQCKIEVKKIIKHETEKSASNKAVGADGDDTITICESIRSEHASKPWNECSGVEWAPSGFIDTSRHGGRAFAYRAPATRFGRALQAVRKLGYYQEQQTWVEGMMLEAGLLSASAKIVNGNAELLCKQIIEGNIDKEFHVESTGDAIIDALLSPEFFQSDAERPPPYNKNNLFVLHIYIYIHTYIYIYQ